MSKSSQSRNTVLVATVVASLGMLVAGAIVGPEKLAASLTSLMAQMTRPFIVAPIPTNVPHIVVPHITPPHDWDVDTNDDHGGNGDWGIEVDAELQEAEKPDIVVDDWDMNPGHGAASSESDDWSVEVEHPGQPSVVVEAPHAPVPLSIWCILFGACNIQTTTHGAPDDAAEPEWTEQTASEPMPASQASPMIGLPGVTDWFVENGGQQPASAEPEWAEQAMSQAQEQASQTSVWTEPETAQESSQQAAASAASAATSRPRQSTGNPAGLVQMLRSMFNFSTILNPR